MPSKPKRNQKEVLGFLGVGLDNTDEHQRLTRNEHFLVVGGSAETHERMQDISIKFNERLKKRGKPLHETTPEEAADLLREATDDL